MRKMIEKHLDELYKKLCSGDESVIQELSNLLERAGVDQGEDSLTYLGRREFLVLRGTKVSKKAKGALVVDVQDLDKVRATIIDSSAGPRTSGASLWARMSVNVTLTEVEGPLFTVELPCGADTFELVVGDLYMGGRGKGRPRLVVRKPVGKTRVSVRFLQSFPESRTGGLVLYRVDPYRWHFSDYPTPPWDGDGSLRIDRVDLRKS